MVHLVLASLTQSRSTPFDEIHIIMIHDSMENAAETRAPQVREVHFTKHPCCVDSHDSYQSSWSGYKLRTDLSAAGWIARTEKLDREHLYPDTSGTANT